MNDSPASALRDWFVRHRRPLPWRDDPTPYRVWISEIMLQQTRASVVIPYFERWMTFFPTLESVASAPLEDLVKAWEGLGYYSRVRNIKKAALFLVERGGVIPSEPEELLKIPGIGPYTAGAVASFAFRCKAPAVDGNVARVISRYYALEGDVKKTVLEEKTLSFLPDEEPWIVMEGLIELGAVFCGKSPRCDRCPLAEGCLAGIEGKTDTIPAPKKRLSTIRLEKSVCILVSGGEVLLEKKREGEVLGGLIEFPSFPTSPEEDPQREIERVFSLKAVWAEDLPEEKYSFTRYEVTLHPSMFHVEVKKETEGFFWENVERLPLLSFSSGHKRILQRVLQRELFATGGS